MPEKAVTQVDVIPAENLGDDLLACWRSIQAENPQCASPFFMPEYVLAWARRFSGIRVAVLRSGNEVVGFFPFEQSSLRVARPVGRSFCDQQGVILKSGCVLNPARLIRKCGVLAYKFDHLSTAEGCFERFGTGRACSPVVDLSSGFETYFRSRKESKNGQITTALARERRLGRQQGPVDWERRSMNRQDLDMLLDWKSRQLADRRQPSRFHETHVRDVLADIMQTQSDGFEGALSVLRVNGRAVAAHLGILSGTVWHYWVLAYDPQFRKYSPGLILLLRILQEAPNIGIRTVDLGKGKDEYKRRLANARVELLEGLVPCCGAIGWGIRSALALRAWIRSLRPFPADKAEGEDKVAGDPAEEA